MSFWNLSQISTYNLNEQCFKVGNAKKRMMKKEKKFFFTSFGYFNA